ncbi:hypothetical protein Tco_1138514 [Tanacetum coccineum]
MISSLTSKDFYSFQYMFYYNLIDEDSYKGKVPPASQPSSSSSAVKKLRIIVVCGDGTAGWILGVISDLNLDQHGFRYYV